jgi:gas vesicle structural protein
MEPVREGHTTLVDVLERILDKGVVLQADLIITLGEIPLVGVNIRAAIAGMETMTRYGLMVDWDEAIRLRAKAPLIERLPAA